MIERDCRCPGCGTCNAASEVGDLRKSLRGWRQRHAELSRINESYIKHLHAAERERDAFRAVWVAASDWINSLPIGPDSYPIGAPPELSDAVGAADALSTARAKAR